MNPEVKSDGTLIFTCRITLKPARDGDLVALYLQAQKDRRLAATIRRLCRSGIGGPERTEYDEDEDLDMGGLGEDV